MRCQFLKACRMTWDVPVISSFTQNLFLATQLLAGSQLLRCELWLCGELLPAWPLPLV